MSGRVRPSRDLRQLWLWARDLEDRRDEAAATGDRDTAHAVNLELEAAADRLTRAIAAEVQDQRTAAAEAKARPSSRQRGGRAFALVDVPADQFDPERPDEPLSVPEGTWARPFWSIDMAVSLKYTAAIYAAWTEEATGARQIRAIDPGQIRVDGGRVGGAPETRVLWLSGRIAAAHRALETCPSLSPLRAHQAGRLRVMTARMIVDHLAIGGRTLREILALGGWSRSPKNLKRLRELVVEALEAISLEWAGGAGSGATAGPIGWRGEGADLVVGDEGTYYIG